MARIGLVQLWDTSKDGMLIGAQFNGHGTAEVSAVAIAPSARVFATAAGNKVLLWPGPGRWADIVCAKMHRNMTEKEWRERVSSEVPYVKQCPELSLPSASAPAAMR